MVVGAFPAIKLAVLLFKQISKPIANYAKERAKNNTFFRTYICMPPAQLYNWCEVKSKMWIMNLGKPVNVPPLNEQMAIELGANMLGEGIIFIVGAVVLILEYNRSSNKEAAKEKQRVDEMNKLIDTVNELYFSSQMHQTKLREMERLIGDLESRVVTKPWTGKHPKPDSDEPPPPPGTISAPLEQLKLPETAEEAAKTSKTKTSDPYPDKNLVMKSLNYVESDIRNVPAPVIEAVPLKAPLYERRPNFLMEALSYLEHDVKGLLT